MTAEEEIQRRVLQAAADDYILKPAWVSVPWEVFLALQKEESAEGERGLVTGVWTTFGSVEIYPGLPWAVGGAESDPRYYIERHLARLHEGPQFYGGTR